MYLTRYTRYENVNAAAIGNVVNLYCDYTRVDDSVNYYRVRHFALISATNRYHVLIWQYRDNLRNDSRASYNLVRDLQIFRNSDYLDDDSDDDRLIVGDLIRDTNSNLDLVGKDL